MTPPRSLEAQVFGQLLEHCTEAVFTVRRDTLTVVTANGGLEEMTGRSRTAVVGGPASQLFGEEHAAEVVGRAGLHEDVALRRMDGYPVFVALTVAYLDHDMGAPLAACIARDTTERRLLERELIAKHMALHAAHADLEKAVASLAERNRELAERNRELSRLGAELALAARRALIGELSAGIAHSLNNPMAALASTQRQILAAIDGHGCVELSSTVERYARRSRDAVARMEQIVQAVRQAHRSGAADSSQPRSVVVADELDMALALFEGRLRGNDVLKVYEGGLRAWAPPGDLQHALWNLIDNAILAMPRGGELRVEAARRGDQVVVAVADSGPGVAAPMRDSLFEPFATGRASGTGLGLSTARRLARDWGGDVRLAASDRGARFEISIPAKEPPCSATRSS